MNIKPLFVFLLCVLVFVTNGAKRDVVFVISGDKDIGLELIKMVLAWYTPEYAPEREDYATALLEAKQAKRGLWGDKNPIAPTEWRENKKTKGEQK